MILIHGAGPRILLERRGAMRLKSFFTFVLGILLSAFVSAQTCNEYTGPGSQTFFSTIQNPLGFGIACTQAVVPEGATIALDWIDDNQTDLINLNAFQINGTFQYFDGSGGTRTSWLFEDAAAGTYEFRWFFSGNLGSEFIHVAGVYPVTAPIPEPSTYALMLAGLGAIAYMAHRRRVKATWVPVPMSTTQG